MTDKPTIPLTQCITPKEVPEMRTLENSENTWINLATRATGLYIHIPFCFHKCHYCDFFSIANADDEHERFTKALLNELQSVGPHLEEIETIYNPLSKNYSSYFACSPATKNQPRTF